MAQGHPQRAVQETLLRHGFRPVYQTAAVTLLEHAGYPDSLVRLGVTRIVAERDGVETYRAALDGFSVEHLLAAIRAQE